jgi:hypothetical protein
VGFGDDREREWWAGFDGERGWIGGVGGVEECGAGEIECDVRGAGREGCGLECEEGAVGGDVVGGVGAERQERDVGESGGSAGKEIEWVIERAGDDQSGSYRGLPRRVAL